MPMRLAALALCLALSSCATSADGSAPTTAVSIGSIDAAVPPPTSTEPSTSTDWSSTSTSPSSTTTTTTLPRRTLSVLAGGDVLNEGWVNQAGRAAAAPGQRFDFTPLFAPVASIVSGADLAICHAELPIGRPDQNSGVYGRSPFGGNLLLAPYEIAPALAATGFDRCSTASNHAFDLGEPGILSTLDALDDAGLTNSGTRRTADANTPSVIEVAGVRVGHLSFTRNWNTVPPADWMLSRATSVERVAAEVASTREQGAEIVIVSLHVGKEMLPAPTEADRAFVTELIGRAAIDLVVIHGPHVVQPYEIVEGTPVFWSLGNFVSGMGRPGTGRYEDLRSLDGLLATVRFTEESPGSFTSEASAVLICNEAQSRVVRAPRQELGSATSDQLTPELRTALQACIDRTLPVIPDIA